MTKEDWKKVKLSYLKGEGSCRELAERFGIAPTALQARCKREGWRREVSKIAQKVSQKTEEAIVDRATKWTEKIISRCERWHKVIDQSIEQAAAGNEDVPAIDAGALDALVRADARVDDMGRRALGLSNEAKEAPGPGITIVIDPRMMIVTKKEKDANPKQIETEAVPA